MNFFLPDHAEMGDKPQSDTIPQTSLCSPIVKRDPLSESSVETTEIGKM